MIRAGLLRDVIISILITNVNNASFEPYKLTLEFIKQFVITTCSKKYLYEDNVNGKITDERFLQLSHKYDVEQEELKRQIRILTERLNDLQSKRTAKESFLKAIRKFMEMKTINPIILKELIEKIEVYQTEGVGKNRKQRLTIHYRFIGTIDIPEAPTNRHTLQTRQGVAVNYQLTAR